MIKRFFEKSNKALKKILTFAVYELKLHLIVSIILLAYFIMTYSKFRTCRLPFGMIYLVNSISLVLGA